MQAPLPCPVLPSSFGDVYRCAYIVYIHTFVGAAIVYMLYDNTGDTYAFCIHKCMVHGMYIIMCVQYTCTFLEMLPCSITQDDVVAGGFSTHLENGPLKCGFPRFSTAVV